MSLASKLQDGLPDATMYSRSAIATSHDEAPDGTMYVALITLDAPDELVRIRAISADEADTIAASLRTLAGAVRAHNQQHQEENK